MRRVWHPRTGTTVFLTHLSTATELVIVNLVTQHDPESDPKFASCGDPGLPQTLLAQFAAVEMLQLRIPAHGVHRRLAPQKAQKRMALFG
jgi:hypothetical protein